jgi:NADPH2:quinone reductase
MKAILLNTFGQPDVLKIGQADPPTAGAGQVLIRVAATSVNRPALIQREGRYPPPPGASPILGLEAAGTIAALGDGVTGLEAGDRVMALLAGGGYAELAVAWAGHVIPMPSGMPFEEAACIPEAYITAYQNLFLNAHLVDGEHVLLHGAGGGVNTAALQICRALVPASSLMVTASPRKVDRMKALGVDLVIDYLNEDFADAVLAFTKNRGADVILDHIGAAYLEKNLSALSVGGRLAIIATMSGAVAEINLAKLMIRRQTVLGSVLRPRSTEEKAEIIASFEADVMPHVNSGLVRPIIHAVLPIERAADAHRMMESSEHFGKIVLSFEMHA